MQVAHAAPTAPVSPATSIPAVAWGARLAAGLVIMLGALTFLLGVCWDIQWHTYIGRDRTLIPPHIMMLSGITLSGVAALVSVLVESALARRIPALAAHSTRFAGVFQSSLGAYVAGYASLAAALAFPLDSYWHSLYGIDVAIWAPFHIMFLAGMSLTTLGAAYTLTSAAQMATEAGAVGAARLAYAGAIAALATLLGTLTILLIDAYRGPLFPVLSGLAVGWSLLTAKYAIPWRWAASLTTLGYLVIAVIVFVYVPPATDALVRSEHLAYLRGQPGAWSVVALGWPLAPVICALLLDGLLVNARAPRLPTARLSWAASAIILVSVIWAPVAHPIGRAVIELAALASPVGLIALAFGALGAFIGVKMGELTGVSMQAPIPAQSPLAGSLAAPALERR